MKITRLTIPIILLLAIGVAGFFTKLYLDAGEFKNLTTHQPGRCRPVLGVESSEDISIDRVTGVAFISSFDRRRFAAGESVQGAIYTYDLTTPGSIVQKATIDLPFEFNPHGISHWNGPGNADRLFVVNHRTEKDFIEIFRVEGRQLTHLDSISGEQLYNANDVLAINENSFYVTRDHGATGAFSRAIENYLQRPWSSVVYYDGSDFLLAAEGIGYANGIGQSPDGSRVFVGGTTDQSLHIYSRNSETGVLSLKDTLALGTGVDNIDVDPEGVIWIGAHPKLLTFTRYSADRHILSPSQVLRVEPEGASYRVEEIYLGSGDYLSGSSVAVTWKDRFLIGSVFDQRFLVCEMAHSTGNN